MGIWGQGGSQFAGYDYVQATEPESPSEGTTWYDLDADQAAVYDGSEWVEMTVTDHGQLGGINPWQHLDQTDVQNAVHDRYTDNEAIQATDGVVDAETVDGQHASNLGGTLSAFSRSTSLSGGGDSVTFNVSGAIPLYLRLYCSSAGSYGDTTRTKATFNFANGASESFSASIGGNDYGSTSQSWDPSSRWSVYTNGSHVESVDLSFYQDPEDDADGQATVHFLQNA